MPCQSFVQAIGERQWSGIFLLVLPFPQVRGESAGWGQFILFLSLFLKRYRETHALSFFDVIVWVLRKFVSWVSKLPDAICEECLWLPASRLSERPSSTILLLPAGNHSTHWYSVLFVARYHQYCANCALPLRPQKLNKSTLHSIVPITSRADIFTVEIAVICCTNCWLSFPSIRVFGLYPAGKDGAPVHSVRYVFLQNKTELSHLSVVSCAVSMLTVCPHSFNAKSLHQAESHPAQNHVLALLQWRHDIQARNNVFIIVLF